MNLTRLTLRTLEVLGHRLPQVEYEDWVTEDDLNNFDGEDWIDAPGVHQFIPYSTLYREPYHNVCEAFTIGSRTTIHITNSAGLSLAITRGRPHQSVELRRWTPSPEGDTSWDYRYVPVWNAHHHVSLHHWLEDQL